MNPLTRHTHEQGMSYIEHWHLAMGIAWRLFNCAIAFSMHAMFPFIGIERRLDLEVTVSFLAERNRQIEDSKQKKHSVLTQCSMDRQSGRLGNL